MFFRTVFIILSLLLSHSPAMGEEVATLKWEDLVPRLPPIENAYTRLPKNLQFDLETIADIKKFGGAGEPGSFVAKLEVSIEDNFANEGLDIEKLLVDYESYRATVETNGQETVGNLEGKLVRIPGYALPLEFTVKAVDMFLLVPYVGACIHVPPPPPNQIVLVTTREPFETKGLYDPVWVTGRMQVKQTNRQLQLVDGEGDIPIGYNMEATHIEPYRENGE